MGPAATAHFVQSVVRNTPAANDNEHISMVVFNNVAIDTRAGMIDEHTSVDELVHTIRVLNFAGATDVVLMCHTWHMFTDLIRSEVDGRFLSLVEETARVISERFPEARKVGLLATRATIDNDSYPANLPGVEFLYPDDQGEVTRAVFEEIKRGDLASGGRRLQRQLEALRKRGADLIVLGCTELSMVVAPAPDVVDPVAVMVDKVVTELV